MNSIPLEKPNIQVKKNKDIISKNERKGIKSLTSDKSIIIKEADKGGAVILMNTEHYKKMAKDILNDTKYYEKLTNDPYKVDRIQDFSNKTYING